MYEWTGGNAMPPLLHTHAERKDAFKIGLRNIWFILLIWTLYFKTSKKYYSKNERDIRFQFLRWVKYRSQFIISVRTENVSEFKPASLWSLVASPQRHLFCKDDDVQAHFPRSSFHIRPSYKFIISGIITLFHSLTTWGLQNAQTTRQCYTVKRTGKIRWADNKMATLNKPTFTLLTS